jgi:hypothetical protein
MIRSQHKEGRPCNTTGERRFQKTEPINEDLTPASNVVSGFPAYKAPEKSGLANFHPDDNRASKQGCTD